MGVTFNGKAATSDPLRLARAHWSLATRPSSTSVLTSISAGKFAACIGAGNCPLPEGTTKVFIFTVSFSVCFVSPLSVSIAPHVMSCFCRFKIISTTELHSVPLAPHFESFAWLRCHLCAKKMHNGTLQIGWLHGRDSGEFVPNKRNSVVLGTSSFIALSFMRKEFRVLCD
jgi:hypothetical protein